MEKKGQMKLKSEEKSTKFFENKEYKLYEVFRNEKIAGYIATCLREEGYFVRTVRKSKSEIEIWVKKNFELNKNGYEEEIYYFDI